MAELDSLINDLDPVIVKTPEIARIKSFIEKFKAAKQEKHVTSTQPLWVQEVNDKSASGGKDFIMKFEELERKDDYSIVRTTHTSGPSVAVVMFDIQGIYNIALQRGKQFFVPLKEWKDEEGRFITKVGFCDSTDIDLKKMYGTDIKEGIDKRAFMSVLQYAFLFGQRPEIK